VKNPTAAMRSTRAATLIGGTAALLIITAGIATAATYPGLDRAGGIHACFSQSATRIVDHFPCKTMQILTPRDAILSEADRCCEHRPASNPPTRIDERGASRGGYPAHPTIPAS
jgi:hypothetical protein